MALPGNLSYGTVVIGLECSAIVDKVEKVRSEEVFSVPNLDFVIVVLGYEEMGSWDVVRIGLRAVSDASFPYVGSEGRERFKEVRDLGGEEGKVDGFLGEMLEILSTSDSSGCVVNNVVSVALRGVRGDPVKDVVSSDSLFVAMKATVVVSFDEIKVFFADVVTLPEYDEVLVFTVLKAKGDVYSVNVFPENKVDFATNSKGDVILDVTSIDNGVTLVASGKAGYLVYSVVKSSVMFRTMCEGYPVVDTVLNVFFNSPKAGEAGVGTDTEGPFGERVVDFSVLELGRSEYGGK